MLPPAVYTSQPTSLSPSQVSHSPQLSPHHWYVTAPNRLHITVVSPGPLCDPFVYRVKVQGHTGVLLFLPLHLQIAEMSKNLQELEKTRKQVQQEIQTSRLPWKRWRVP
ncbi:uncharacterized protein AAG666_008532 [Megaptera novaeangliae]